MDENLCSNQEIHVLFEQGLELYNTINKLRIIMQKALWTRLIILRMANFDNFGGLKYLRKFHIFIFFTCEKSVGFRFICEEMVR